MKEPFRVVIIGGGFAGIRVAQQLARSRDRDRLSITLISKSALHVFTPALYALAGAVSESARRKQLERCTALPLRRICAGLPIALIEAAVTNIALEARYVDLDDGRKVTFDSLVIALGSEPAYYGIPGLEEHAITLKSTRDALAINQAVTTRMRGRNRPLRVVIGGGGPTGVELAGMLAEQIGRWQAGTHVTLIEAQQNLLNGCPSKAQVYAAKQLEKRGVVVKTNTRITNASHGTVTLNDTEQIPHDILIWTGGIQAPALITNLPLVTEHGRIVADAPLTVTPVTGGTMAHVFALGDAAVFHSGERIAPWTAHVAMEQADFVAINIRRLVNKQRQAHFKVGILPFVIPIGKRGGIGWYGFLTWYGRIVPLITKLVEVRYLFGILRWREAWKLGLKRIRN